MNNHTLFLDCETRSPENLTKCGVYKYAQHVRTGYDDGFEILLISYQLDSEPIKCFSPLTGWDSRFIAYLLDPNTIKIAHNANFDRVCLSTYFCAPHTFLPPVQWVDTMAMAAVLDLPHGLDNLAKYLSEHYPTSQLANMRKLAAGKTLITRWRALSAVRRLQTALAQPSKNNQEIQAWDDFAAYCSQDVRILVYVYESMNMIAPMPADEQTVWVLDQQINDRGIMIDQQIIRAAAQRIAQMADDAQRIADSYGVNPKSPAQLKTWLAAQGYPTESINKATVQQILDGSPPEQVRRMLALRVQAGASSLAKFEAIINRTCDDGRARGVHQYYGARTGRWAGRGIQTQNLPRIPDSLADRIAYLADHPQKITTASNDELKCLLRASIISGTGMMTIADYSAIEARVIAWLAGDVQTLQVFAVGEDIYKATIARMENINIGQVTAEQRQRGKIATLALGYGGGAQSLYHMGGDKIPIPDDFVKAYREQYLADLISEWRKQYLGYLAPERGGVAPITTPSEYAQCEQYLVQLAQDWRTTHPEAPDTRNKYLRQLVQQWRTTHPEIVALWRRLENAYRQALTGESTRIGALTVSLDGTDTVTIQLPSSRKLYYRGSQQDTDGNLSYVGRQGRLRVWGGILVENATQAVARDLLAHGMITATQARAKIVAHIHDEIVAEDTIPLAEYMCQLPTWAMGLPLSAAQAQHARYLGH